MKQQQLTVFGQNALAKFIANSTLLETLGLNKTVTQDVNWHPTILLHLAGRKTVYLEQQEQIVTRGQYSLARVITDGISTN